ncbi:MAG: hypothetical protein ABSG17_21765 [Spirochaetia bacterium]|jgi:hypothetical protein
MILKTGWKIALLVVGILLCIFAPPFGKGIGATIIGVDVVIYLVEAVRDYRAHLRGEK